MSLWFDTMDNSFHSMDEVYINFRAAKQWRKTSDWLDGLFASENWYHWYHNFLSAGCFCGRTLSCSALSQLAFNYELMRAPTWRRCFIFKHSLPQRPAWDLWILVPRKGLSCIIGWEDDAMPWPVGLAELIDSKLQLDIFSLVTWDIF